MGLKYCDLHVTYKTERMLPPHYIISGAMRGLFGLTLKRVLCIQRQIRCDTCSMTGCLYREVFEYRDAQNDGYKPYIIRHEAIGKNSITVQYLFIGTVTNQMQSLLHVLMRMPEYKLTFANDLMEISILKITDDKKAVIYNHKDDRINMPVIRELQFKPVKKKKVQLNFISPLRMHSKQGPRNEFGWEWFYNGLERRIRYLDENFNNNELNLPEKLAIDNPKAEADLHWYDMHHRSSRQQKLISMGGLMGSVIIHNPHPDTVGLLKLGEKLHIGKQTTFGLGKYTLSTGIIKKIRS